MPWIIGIDEAGYGPNLGPLVMTAVAARVPEALAAADLWQVLRAVVRRQDSPPDGRLLVEDSKVVYNPGRGLRGLEENVTALLPLWRAGEAITLDRLVQSLSPAHAAEVAAEPWFSGQSRLPLAAAVLDVAALGARFDQACREAGVDWAVARSAIICPRQFNGLLDRWGTKGAVLGEALLELVRSCQELPGDQPLHFTVDKHGGRNYYAAMLQEAFPVGIVAAEAEGMARSTYRVLGLDREVRLTFQPRADAEHFCVALASMVSKYVREVLMVEFNQFWRMHLPDLQPTAGYPGDAARFFAAIRPAIARLGLAEESVWRRR